MKKKKLSPPLLIVTHRQVTPPPFSYSVALLLIDWLNLFMQVGFPLFSLRLQHSLYSEWNQFGTEWFEEEEWKSNVISCLRIAAAAHKKKKRKSLDRRSAAFQLKWESICFFFFLSLTFIRCCEGSERRKFLCRWGNRSCPLSYKTAAAGIHHCRCAPTDCGGNGIRTEQCPRYCQVTVDKVRFEAFVDDAAISDDPMTQFTFDRIIIT